MFFHELWHIYLGHVTYWGLNGTGFRFPELPRQLSDNNAIAQAMELQADGNAAATLFSVLGQKSDGPSHYFASVGMITAILLMGLSPFHRNIED